MLNNDIVAALVAAQLKADFDMDVTPEPTDESRSRHGDEDYFSLAVTQEFGIFKTVIKSAYIRVRSGEVKSADGETTQLSVMVGLHYDHLHGGSNGANIGTYWFDADQKLVGSRTG